MPSRFSTASPGTAATSAVRPRSAATRIGRRGSRSTQTPAISPSSSAGANWAATSSPISAGPAPSQTTAVSGSASALTCDPTADTLCPAQAVRKASLRQSPAPPFT